LSNGISLGVYRDQESVERRLRQLKEKGYANVQTEKIYKTDTKYWLTVKISAVALLDVFKKTPSVSTATSVECK
jgi:D-aminopeptidase